MQVIGANHMESENQHMSHHPMKPHQAIKNLKEPAGKQAVPKRANRRFGADITNRGQPNRQQTQATRQLSKQDLSKPELMVVDTHSENTEEPQAPPKPLLRDTDAMDTCETVEHDTIVSIKALAPWDAIKTSDDLFVTEYVAEIMHNLMTDEKECSGVLEEDVDFMAKQQDVNERMRTVLVDWLIEVHRKFKLLPVTYFLAINLLDRYLNREQIHRRKLQLTGCTCLWIASKYHEIYAPEMDEFVYISDNAFNMEELMAHEINVLKALSFRLTVPTVFNFAQRYTLISAYYLKNSREMKIITDLIMYCIEHCVLSYELCRKKPSLIGAACFVYACIATKAFTVSKFTEDAIDETVGYDMDTLLPIMRKVDAAVNNARKSKQKAVYKKYCGPKYSNVGRLNFDKLDKSFLE